MTSPLQHITTELTHQLNVELRGYAGQERTPELLSHCKKVLQDTLDRMDWDRLELRMRELRSVPSLLKHIPMDWYDDAFARLHIGGVQPSQQGNDLQIIFNVSPLRSGPVLLPQIAIDLPGGKADEVSGVCHLSPMPGLPACCDPGPPGVPGEPGLPADVADELTKLRQFKNIILGAMQQSPEPVVGVDEALAARICNLLNELSGCGALTARAIYQLVEFRQPVDAAAAMHPTVQVISYHNVATNTAIAEVGMLGILNGLCGVYTAENAPTPKMVGCGPIAVYFEPGGTPAEPGLRSTRFHLLRDLAHLPAYN